MEGRDKEVEKLLALHCAPALAGLKAANLFSAPKPLCARALAYGAQLSKRGVSMCELCGCEKRGLVLVYREALLKRRLSDPQAAACLKAFGYPVEAGLSASLAYLKRRTAENAGFPHEIGVFLDYPLEDVRGFIENGGRCAKACGFWKVYGDVEAAKAAFSRLAACRDEWCRRLSMGEALFSLVAA